MASNSEVGHAKNLANLKLLKDLIAQVGAPYAPSNALLTVASVTTLIATCQADYNNWTAKLILFKDESDKREIAFEPIGKLVTEINSSVQQLNEPQQTFNDIQALVSKIHGADNRIKKSIASKQVDPSIPIDPSNPTPLPIDPISTAQLSYDSLLKNFDLLIQRLQTITAYAPNEVDIQIATLTALFTTLTTLNLNAGSATNTLNLARNQRNLSFYAPATGLYDITIKIKKYLKSNKITKGAIYKTATQLKFVKIVQKKKKKKAK